MADGLLFGMEPGDFDFTTPESVTDMADEQYELEQSRRLAERVRMIQNAMGDIEQQPEPYSVPRLPMPGEPDMAAVRADPGYVNAPTDWHRQSIEQLETENAAEGAITPQRRQKMAILEGIFGAASALRGSQRERRGKQRLPYRPLFAGQLQRHDEETQRIAQENQRRGLLESTSNQEALNAYRQRQGATVRAVLPSLASSTFRGTRGPGDPASVREVQYLESQPWFRELDDEAKQEIILRNIAGNEPRGSSSNPTAAVQKILFARSQPFYQQMAPQQQQQFEQDVLSGASGATDAWLDRLMAKQYLYNADPLNLVVPRGAPNREQAVQDLTRGQIEGVRGVLGKPQPGEAPPPAPTAAPGLVRSRGAAPPGELSSVQKQALQGYRNAVRDDPASAKTLREDFMLQYRFDPDAL